MIIKKLRIEDFKAHEITILELLVNTYMGSFQISKEQSITISKEKLLLLTEYIKEESAVLIAACEDENLVGFLWLYKHTYFGEVRLHINQIAVSERFRGRGIGKQLMQEAENHARQNTIKTIDLFVSETNLEAVNMYNVIGFTTERRYMRKVL